jgi:hypothetical protein
MERRKFCFGVLLDKWVLLCTLDLDLNLYHFVMAGLRSSNLAVGNGIKISIGLNFVN